MRNFTRGLITGTIIGTAVAMMIPSGTNARLRRRMFRNGKTFIRTASNIIENLMDL